MSNLIAKNIRYFRELAHMTQEDLARQTGLTRNLVANYENGRTAPNFEILCMFADVLGVDLTDFNKTQDQLPVNVRKIQVTEDEAFLLDIYRKADPTYAGVAVDILRSHPKEG